MQSWKSYLTPRTIGLCLALISAFVVCYAVVTVLLGAVTPSLVPAMHNSVGLAPSHPPMRGQNEESLVPMMPERKMGAMSDLAYPVEAPPLDLPTTQSMMVRTVSLQLGVTSITSALRDIESVGTTYDGMVGERVEGGDARFTSGRITVWVPAEHLDDAVVEMKAVGSVVKSEHLRTEDVSWVAVDLGARLRNLEASEIQYQSIMKRAGTITEVLQVERELERTRGEIERVRQSLTQLEGRIALSRIDIELTEDVSVSSASHWRLGTVVKNAYHELLYQLSVFVSEVIVFLILLPVALAKIAFWLGVFYLAYRMLLGVYGYARRQSLP